MRIASSIRSMIDLTKLFWKEKSSVAKGLNKA